MLTLLKKKVRVIWEKECRESSDEQLKNQWKHVERARTSKTELYDPDWSVIVKNELKRRKIALILKRKK